MIVQIQSPFMAAADNENKSMNPNVTTLAMALSHYKVHVPGEGSERLADVLGLHMGGGCRPPVADEFEVRAMLAAYHLIEPDGTSDLTTWAAVKQHLTTDNVVLVRSFLAPDRHYVVVCGFDELNNRWLVNDPMGYWPRYDRMTSGRQVWYEPTFFTDREDPGLNKKITGIRLRKVVL